jgi:hypothetical protein
MSKSETEKDSQSSKAINPHSEDYDARGKQDSGAADVHETPKEKKSKVKKQDEE